MGFACGIVGLPNVGKSTIFNALTSAKAASENFPFCTIEPNTGTVPVPDPRLSKLAELASSAKIIPTQMTFVDIAGLIKGASKGEGLGNQFLGHIRSVDAICQVVRCFEDENITHVDGNVDPVRDVSTIETELILADIESLAKQITKAEKNAKSGNKEEQHKLNILKTLLEHLNNGNLAKTFTEIPADINLLTAKPVMYVVNTKEGEDENEYTREMKKHAEEQNTPLITISGKVESEISELPKAERQEYLEALGLEQSGLDRLVIAGHKLLNLITYFTIGPKEAHAWTILKGTTAPQAAGKIHSDFEDGFIRAEVISCEDYLAAGSEVKAKENGKMRVEGKEYVVQDGDIMHFRFNK